MKKITLIALFAILVIGCKKGDKGDPGLPGANGTNGTNGTNGLNGNANVKSGEPFIVQPTSWIGPAPVCRTTIQADIITQEIFDKGAVLVYFKSGSVWLAIPVTVNSSSLNYSFKPGSLDLMYYYYDTPAVPPSLWQFRIVTLASGSSMALPAVATDAFFDAVELSNNGPALDLELSAKGVENVNKVNAALDSHITCYCNEIFAFNCSSLCI